MFLNRGINQYAILSSMVFTPSCPVTISGSSSFYRLTNVVDKLSLKRRMNSRGAAALAALTAAGALLAYILFRKKEPKVKEVEEVIQVEQEEVIEKVEPREGVTNNDEQERGLEEIEKVELADEVTTDDEQEKGLEEECLKTDEAKRGKESLMEWIDRQLEEAERKTGGSPWPDIPEEDEVEIAGGEVCPDGASVNPDQSFDSQEVGRDFSDVKRDLQEAEKQLLGAELQLEEAKKCVLNQEEGEYEQSGEIKRAADEREGEQAAGTSASPLAESPKQPLDVVFEGALRPESNIDNIKAGNQENVSSLGANHSSCTGDNNGQFDMSSDSEIELLKEPSTGSEDNETGQLLDETESEGENAEDVTLDVSLKNEVSEPAEMGSDAVKDTPDELIALRPAWQKNLPSKS